MGIRRSSVEVVSRTGLSAADPVEQEGGPPRSLETALSLTGGVTDPTFPDINQFRGRRRVQIRRAPRLRF